jgi:hypothetical protein
MLPPSPGSPELTDLSPRGRGNTHDGSCEKTVHRAIISFVKSLPKAFAGLVLGSCLLGFAFAQADKPAPASELVGKAQAQAMREKKAVFILFDASW